MQIEGSEILYLISSLILKIEKTLLGYYSQNSIIFFQGGGGMMLIHEHRSNKSVIIDFRETAPASATNEKYFFSFFRNPA